MKAIILAGGKGAKMAPYSAKRQKCCLPIGNTPNILRMVQQLHQLAITDITVFTGYMAQDILHSLGGTDGVKVVQSDNLWTAFNTLADQALDCLVCYGDIYAHESDISRVVEHKNSVLLQQKTDDFLLGDYIGALVADGAVKSICAHPRGQYANTRCGGIYHLSSQILQLVKSAPAIFSAVPCGGMPDDSFHPEQLLQMALEQNISLVPVLAEHCLVDMDFPWDILFANEAYCLEEVAAIDKSIISATARVSDRAEIRGNIIVEDGAVIGSAIFEGNCIVGKNAVIENGAIIGKNCVIGENARVTDYCRIQSTTVIGRDNKIGFSAEISGVTFEGVSAVHGCEIYGVMGRKVDIAAGCTMGILRFDDKLCSKKINGRIYANRFTNAIFVGDYTRTGVNNVFNPGITVGVNCALGAGLLVTNDVPDATLIIAEQTTASRPWSNSKYGW